MQNIVFLSEKTTLKGIRRIEEKVAGDFEKVTGHRPVLKMYPGEWKLEGLDDAGFSNAARGAIAPGAGAPAASARYENEKKRPSEASGRTTLILAATLGRSPLTEQLIAAGRLPAMQVEKIRGKREVYLRLFLPARSEQDTSMPQNASAGQPFSTSQEQTCCAPKSASDGQRLPSGKEQAESGKVLSVAAKESATQDPFPDADLILILGSDKRGTIYGLFSLSEYIGVTPLTFWGDAPVLHQTTLLLDAGLDAVSREPSVEYRGFFINDEWPAFGNWCMEHFGGFNASLYDCVFEFLLRMKGNYIWPAMWSSSFPLDGPGEADMELADEYGVIWSFSHHEPCLRASEEWDKVRGEHSVYGNDWDFGCNREGLLRYWEDALTARGHYENMITIGMRGERDSALLGENSPVRDNVLLLKEIISAQRTLIRKLEEQGKIRKGAPQMLAVYKEVEEYYYGNEDLEGLGSWDGLDGVICMLSDDNFGHLRTLPTRAMQGHDGGYGMYYHLDYHGGPVSYEWIDSTPFSQIWEEMCEAWDYGVRKLWIVNVGDVKFHELPLLYFMELAYDFDRLGTAHPESYLRYPGELLRQNFPEELPGMSPSLRQRMEEVLNGYLFLSQLRRPESLHAGIYHASHEGESQRVLALADALEEKNRQVLSILQKEGGPEQAAFRGYYSMIGWPAMALCNLVRMYLCEGINHRLAEQGRPAANLWAARVRECLVRDKALSAEWRAFLGGKWAGMELPHHIGFTKWNDFGRKFPVTMELEPAEDPILCVSRADEDAVAVRIYGDHESIAIEDFRYLDNTEVFLELSNNGTGELGLSFRNLPAWLEADCEKTVLGTGELVTASLRILREKMTEPQPEIRQQDEADLAASENPSAKETEKETPGEDVTAVVEIAGSDETVVDLLVTARSEASALPGRGSCGVIVLEAEAAESKEAEAAESKAPGAAVRQVFGQESKEEKPLNGEETRCRAPIPEPSWQPLPSYGKYGFGQKVYPDTESFAKGDWEAPALSWEFEVGEEGDYIVRILTAPSNPLEFVRPLTLGAEIWQENQNVQRNEVTLAQADRTIGSCSNASWSRAVLDQERVAEESFHLEKGHCRLRILAREAGTVVERICLMRADRPLPESYLGPEKAWPSFFA